MGIANRDKDASEQNYLIQNTYGLVGTGISLIVGLVPSAGQIQALKFTGKGLSAAPVYNLAIVRWTSAGVTYLVPGSAITLAGAFGLSGGALGATYAANSSLAAVQSGDMLVLNTSGADTAALQLSVAVVIKATQDIKKSFDI